MAQAYTNLTSSLFLHCTFPARPSSPFPNSNAHASFTTAHPIATTYATNNCGMQRMRLTPSSLPATAHWENQRPVHELHQDLASPRQASPLMHEILGTRLLNALRIAQFTGTDIVFPQPCPVETHSTRLLEALRIAQLTGTDIVFPFVLPVETHSRVPLGSLTNGIVPTDAGNHEEKTEAEGVVGTCGVNESYMPVVPRPAIDDSSLRTESRALSTSSDTGLDAGLDWYSPAEEMYGQALADELLAPGMKQRLDKLEEDAAERVKTMEALKAGTLYDYFFAFLQEGESSLAADNDAESEGSWTASSDSASELFVVWGQQENATEESDVEATNADKAARNSWDHLVIEEGALAGPQTWDSAQEMRDEYCETLEDILDLLRAVDSAVEGQ